MKFLWFFLMLICIASCCHRHKDVVEEQEEGLDYPLNHEFDKKFQDEQWQDLDAKESDASPELNEFLLANFNSGVDTNLESENKDENPEFNYNYRVGEEIDGNDSPLFPPEYDELFLFKESPSLNSEKENSDKESEEYINDDWLYNFDYIVNKLNKQKEEDNINNNNNKYGNMDKLQLPVFKTDEENNDKFSNEKANDDILFLLGNENDYFLDKLSEEKKDNLGEEKKDADSLDNEDKMDILLLPYYKFDQENEKPTEEKENGDWFLFPSVNDYEYPDNLNQENKDLDTINKNSDNKFVLLRSTETKIRFIILNVDDHGRDGNPEMADGKNGLERDSFSEGKDFDSSNDANNNGQSKTPKVTTIVIVVSSIIILVVLLLCKLCCSSQDYDLV